MSELKYDKDVVKGYKDNFDTSVGYNASVIYVL